MLTTANSVINDMYFQNVKVDIGDQMHVHFRGHSMRMQVKEIEPIFSEAYPSIEIGVSVRSEIVGILE